MIVPVRKDPEALPACQDNTDIHPDFQVSDFDSRGRNLLRWDLSCSLETFGILAAKILKPNDIVHLKSAPCDRRVKVKQILGDQIY